MFGVVKKRSHSRSKPERKPLLSRLFTSVAERKARMKERHYTTIETTVNLQPYGNLVKRGKEEQAPPPPEKAVTEPIATTQPRVRKMTIWNPW